MKLLKTIALIVALVGVGYIAPPALGYTTPDDNPILGKDPQPARYADRYTGSADSGGVSWKPPTSSMQRRRMRTDDRGTKLP